MTIVPPFSVVQFLIPKSVDAELQKRRVALRARAIAGGVLAEHAHYESNTRGAPPTRTRVTAHRPMAAAIIEEIAAIADEARGQLVLDCAAAGMAGLEALKPAAAAPDQRSDKERGLLGL